MGQAGVEEGNHAWKYRHDSEHYLYKSTGKPLQILVGMGKDDDNQMCLKQMFWPH